MTAVSVTGGITWWDWNCYAAGSHAASKGDLNRQFFREVFSGCHSNIYHKTSRSSCESSVVHIHGVHNGVIMAQRRAKKTRRLSHLVVDQGWRQRGATGVTGK